MGAGARKAEAVPTTVAKVRNFMLGKEGGSCTCVGCEKKEVKSLT